MIPTAETENRSRHFLQFAHIKISYIFCDIVPVPRRQQESLSRPPLSGIHPAAVSFSLMGISPPRSRPGTLVQVSSFLPPVIATVGCCPPTVGLSSYGSPISRQRKCCTGSIGIQLSKISLAQPVTKNTIAGRDTLQRLSDGIRTAF